MNWAGMNTPHSVLIGKVKRPWQNTEGGTGDVRGKPRRCKASVQSLCGKGDCSGQACGSHGRGPSTKRRGMGRREVVERREGLAKERRENSG
jgi:hypothetical protein